MPNADGYITYSTKLDNTELEAELKQSKKSIADLQKEIEKTLISVSLWKRTFGN